MGKRNLFKAATAFTALAIVSAGCSSATSNSGSADGGALKVGMIVSETGVFTTQAKDFEIGFNAGLDYLTKGTNKVNGVKIEVTKADDQGDPTVGAAKAKELIGNGNQVLMGATASPVALAVAQLGVQNNVMYLPGTSGTFQLTGMSPLVFGNNSQGGDLTLPKIIGDAAKGKNYAFIAQDYAYGQDTYKSFATVMTNMGVNPVPYLLPRDTTDFTGLALKLKEDKPDYLGTSWAGTGVDQLWSALAAQGVLKQTDVVAQVLLVSDWATLGNALGEDVAKATVWTPYFAGATGNDEEKYLVEYSKKHGHQIEYDDPTGWDAAAMLVEAIKKGGTDVKKMADSLNDFTWTSPAGETTLRGADHAKLQPRFVGKLEKGADGNWKFKLTEALKGEDVATDVMDPIKK